MYQDFDDSEENEGLSEALRSQHRAAIERSKSEFIQGCYDAYDLLVKKGPEVLEETNPKEIQKAINRMTQLFLMKEEYERCSFLKQYVKAHMPEFEITPDKNLIKELSI